MNEENKTVAPPISDEIAVITKDVDVTEGFFLENPDPTILSESKGKGLKLYDEIDRDAHAGAVLQTRYLSIAGEKWEITPGDDTPKAKEIAEFVTSALKKTNFKQAVAELLQSILYGFYNTEIMWSVQDGKVVPERFIGKHPRRFSFTMDRELRLLTRDNPTEGEAIPDRKIITFSYGDSDNPYGKGLGQKLWWPVWFKKHGIKFWLIFLDKFGMPTGVGKYKSGAKDEEKKTLLDAIAAIHSETGVAIPDTMAIDLLEASRSGKVTYETLCEYMDKQISKATLGQTLTTEVSGGSYAASQTHDDVRQDIKEADAGLLAECLNRTVIRWTVDYNFAGTTAYPTLRFITEKEQVLKELAERDEVLVNQIGVEVEPDYFYDTYNLPRPAGGARITRPQSPAGEFSESTVKPFTPEQQALEDLAATALAATDLTENEKQILDIVESASSYEEAMENLLDFYPEMKMDSLQESLEKALLAADLHGVMTVNNG
jgi:phage gp29-like protein